MNDIPTWQERARSHPDHQSGMISEDMLRARMTEEIMDLRAEVGRLRAALREAALMSDCCAWCRAEVADFCRKALKAKP